MSAERYSFFEQRTGKLSSPISVSVAFRPTPTRSTLGGIVIFSVYNPEAFVHLTGLFFEKRSGDHDRPLSASEDFAAG